MLDRVCLLGFGEVGQRLAPALLAAGVQLRAYDQLFADASSAPSRAAQKFSDITFASTAIEAVHTAQLVISAVTAGQNLAAAKSIISGLTPGTWFLDLNSVSPHSKQQVATIVEAAGGRYVEAAVMGPVAPQGIASPIFLGGPQAQAFLPEAQTLGFTGASFYHAELGRASACKMCRSVLIKGLESLFTESLLAAHHYGVEEGVINSLDNLMPGVDWQKHAPYMISRSLEHGQRRAEEMREAATTVAQAGIVPRMASACAETQAWAATLSSALEFTGESTPLKALLTRMAQRHSSSSVINSTRNRVKP